MRTLRSRIRASIVGLAVLAASILLAGQAHPTGSAPPSGAARVARQAGERTDLAGERGPTDEHAQTGARPHDRTAGIADLGAGAPGPATPTLVPTPAAGATDVSVIEPVTVSGRDATLDTVTLSDAAGRPVPGGYDAGRRGWRSTEPLAYHTRYTLTASGSGPTGEHLTRSSTFTTVRPANLTLPYLRANDTLRLADRQTYGVGQPIVVRFDEKIPDRAAAQRALQVTTTPAVDGAWHWFGDQEVHWRPRVYWPAGTKVTVAARVYGQDLGGGLYGQRDVSASFTIGPSKIAIADDGTFRMRVYVGGEMVREMPIAMGRHTSLPGADGQRIDLRTHSGVHVVLGSAQVTRMASASFGLTGPDGYDQLVYWTTQISYSGEYVHAAPWSVPQQGHSDASHGCINVNTGNAIWFHDTFIPGDIVDVRNTGLPLRPDDGLGDWTLSWNDWVSGSALPAGAPG